MKHNIYIYILVMFAVTYLIRVLPLMLIRKRDQKIRPSVVSVLCALCHAGGYDVSRQLWKRQTVRLQDLRH